MPLTVSSPVPFRHALRFGDQLTFALPASGDVGCARNLVPWRLTDGEPGPDALHDGRPAPRSVRRAEYLPALPFSMLFAGHNFPSLPLA